MTMGEKILNMRKARGWSQEELADRIGVTRQAVSRWEAGSAKPDADKIVCLCVLFSISSDYLLGLDEKISIKGGIQKPSEGKNWLQYIKCKIIKLSLSQAVGGVLFFCSLISILILKILSIISPTEYIYVQGDGKEHYYIGLSGYIKANYLDLLFCIIVISLIVGAIMMIWSTFKSNVFGGGVNT